MSTRCNSVVNMKLVSLFKLHECCYFYMYSLMTTSRTRCYSPGCSSWAELPARTWWEHRVAEGTRCGAASARTAPFSFFVPTSEFTGNLQEVAEVQGTVQSVQAVTMQRALGNKLYHHLPPTALLLGEWVRETNMAKLKKLLLKWTRKLQSIKTNCCYPAAGRW